MYNNGDLKRKDNTLQFTAYDGEKRDIPIERISDIYVMSEMSFNTTFLNYISQYGIPIHFFNYYNYYSGSFYPKDGNPAGQLLVKQVEHYVDYDKRLDIAIKFIQAAADNIYRNLRYYNGREKDVSEYMRDIDSLRGTLCKARTIEELMGIEGNIRKRYYAAWNVIVNQDIRFDKGYTEAEAIQYYIDELNRIFDEGAPASEIACMIVEPFQGEGGFIPAPIEWVKAVRKICDDNGILMIADEVQCGNCRTGKYYASEYWAEAGAAPDIITTAKSLGAGLPISAITARAEVMDAAPAGTIGGTFCGNPVAAAAALAVMDVMKRDDYAAKARHIGETVMKRYKELQDKYDVIGDVRGLGAMVGIEFVKDRETKEPATKLVADLIQNAIQKGLLLESCGTASNTVRFLAPLTMTDEQMERGLEIFEEALKEALEA